MICLYAETHISTVTLFFYTCIWIPFLQITHTVLRFFSFLLDPHGQPEATRFEENSDWELDLPVTQFQETEINEISTDQEMCSICLMDFDKEDMVNKLPKCGHVFHVGCLEKWLDRCQFTCPLCRALVLRCGPSPPCKIRASDVFCINLPAAHDS